MKQAIYINKKIMKSKKTKYTIGVAPIFQLTTDVF